MKNNRGSITLIALIVSALIGGGLVLWGTKAEKQIAQEPVLGAFSDPFIEVQGGTGTSTYVIGDILYADGDDTLGSLPIGSAGQILEVSPSGIPEWDTDDSGAASGSPGAWETLFTNALRPTNTSAGIFVQASSTIDGRFIAGGTAVGSSTLYALNQKVGINTTTPEYVGLALGMNNRIKLQSNMLSNDGNNSSLILKYDTTQNNAAKVNIAFESTTSTNAWIAAHDYHTDGTWHGHLSFETKDETSNALNSRLTIGHHCDTCDIEVVNANFNVVGGNLTMGSGRHLIFNGDDAGEGQLRHGGTFELVPNTVSTRGSNSSDYLTIATTTDSDGIELRGFGATYINVNDNLTVTGKASTTDTLIVGNSTKLQSNEVDTSDDLLVSDDFQMGGGNLTMSGSDNQLLYLQSTATGDYASTIRVTGESAGQDFQGGYWQYDATNNQVIFGVHNTADELTANDIEAFLINRAGTLATLTPALILGSTNNPTLNLSDGDLWAVRATTTNLAVSSLSAASCDVKALTNGSLYCGTDATGAGGGEPGAWNTFSANVLRPTNTVAAILVNAASSTITGLVVSDSLTVPNDSIALTTKTTGNYAAGDAEAGAALTGDSATSFFSLGQIENARGGTGQDSSGWSGIAVVNSGTWSASSTLAVNRGGIGVGTIGAGELVVGNGTSPITSTSTLSVVKGGTGATTLTDGGILFGGGTSLITASTVLTNGQLLIGDGSGVPTAATLTGTADEITITNGAGSITIDIPDPLIVSKGGTGAATLASTEILVGAGTSAITSTSTVSVVRGGTGQTTLAAGSIFYGNGTSPMTALAIGTTRQVLQVNTGATAPEWTSNILITQATTTNFAVTGMTAANCDVKATTDGVFYCGTDSTSAGGGEAGAWETFAANVLRPTNTAAAILVNAASSTITNLIVSDSFTVPNGSNLTLNAIGEVSLDTAASTWQGSGGQFLIATSTDAAGAAVFGRALTEIYQFTIASSTALVSGDVITLPPKTAAFRIVRFQCYVGSGTSVVMNLTDGDNNDTNTVTCGTATQGTYASTTSNFSFNAGEIVKVELGTNTGSSEDLSVSAIGYWLRE